MLDRIRLATEEEVEKIKDESNLTPMSRVLAMGDMLAVWRVANEIDPVHFNEAPAPKMYKFLWGMENILKGAGVSEYFFNTPADDEKYNHFLKEMGAERLSKQPDYRWRVNL
jgi:hypothetical protein